VDVREWGSIPAAAWLLRLQAPRLPLTRIGEPLSPLAAPSQSGAGAWLVYLKVPLEGV